jgi:endonuclease/exonuclease/phosphatase family metal-dependent hydrolase
MTLNIYQGTELEHVLAARDPFSALLAVATDYRNVIATDFPARAGALADEIAAAQPSLVGLQEVATWTTGPPFQTPTHVSYDFLQILLDALAARGQHYAAVIVRPNFHAEAPGLFGPSFPADLMEVGLTEQTAIIARTDLPTDELKLSNPQSHDFAVATSIPLLTGPFSVGGGWLSVDAKVRGKSFRFVTTHMDPISQAARDEQANEILAGTAGLPVVLAGDTNSESTTTAYAEFTGAGLVDSWSALHPGDPGLTCCQVPPDTIVNPVSQLHERVDYVFAGPGVEPLSIELVGADPSSRLPGSGLWPTDHAGLVATLGLDPLPNG